MCFLCVCECMFACVVCVSFIHAHCCLYSASVSAHSCGVGVPQGLMCVSIVGPTEKDEGGRGREV